MAVKVNHDGNATGALTAGAGGKGVVLRRGGSWILRDE